jgi:Ca2+-binding RTX toxin-like protein
MTTHFRPSPLAVVLVGFTLACGALSATAHAAPTDLAPCGSSPAFGLVPLPPPGGIQPPEGLIFNTCLPSGPAPHTACTIFGTPGPDVLRGTPGKDIICARGGDDVVFGLGGDDVLVGGSGNDKLIGGPGRDVPENGDGRDLLLARDGRLDILLGGSGQDRARADHEDLRASIEAG